jgi:hypothetical protein
MGPFDQTEIVGDQPQRHKSSQGTHAAQGPDGELGAGKGERADAALRAGRARMP